MGNLHQVKVTDIPFGKLRDKGVPIDNLSKFDGTKERVLFLTSFDQMMGKKLIFATKMALIKQVPAEEFITNNRTVASTKFQDDDKLVTVRLASEGDAVLQTAGGYFLRFDVSEISEMKKNSKGVRGIKLERDDELENLYLVNEDAVVTYKKKEIQLNRLKLAKRDGKGTKVRL
jgi:DNA gyrase subunit A